MESCGTLGRVDNPEHARRLEIAVESSPHSRAAIAAYVGRTTRSLSNWTKGRYMPDESEKILLREMVGPYDTPGDPVEVAIHHSELTEDRQAFVLGTYKKYLREQREDRTA